MTLAGKTAIVTGGANGIGLAIAERLLREDARVLIADVDTQGGETAERDLGKLGEIRFMKVDVARRLDIHNMVAAAIDAFGDIDILVNNAGIAPPAGFLELRDEELDRVLAVNLKGAFLSARAAARFMIDKVTAGGTPGTIINLSASAALRARPDQLAYAVSKAGLDQLTETMAGALAPWKIRVNAVAFGSASVAADEVAARVAFLASADAADLTGRTIQAGDAAGPAEAPGQPPAS